MADRIRLANIKPGISYVVAGFMETASTYSEKLCKMGFVTGTRLELAPVNIVDPMVVRIRGSRIALRKNEAEQILVEEVRHA